MHSITKYTKKLDALIRLRIYQGSTSHGALLQKRSQARWWVYSAWVKLHPWIMLSVTGSSSPHSQLPQYCHGLLQRRAAYQLMHEQQFLVLLPFLLRLWIVIKNIFILSLINTGNPNQQPTNRNTRNDCFNQHHLLTDTTSSSSPAPPPVHH